MPDELNVWTSDTTPAMVLHRASWSEADALTSACPVAPPRGIDPTREEIGVISTVLLPAAKVIAEPVLDDVTVVRVNVFALE